MKPFQIVSRDQLTNLASFALLPYLPAALPALAIDHILIWEGSPGDQVIRFDLGGDRTFSGIFYDLFPSVSFVEVLRLWTLLTTSFRENLLDRWNLDAEEDWETQFYRILNLPLTVQVYLAEKKFFPRDLRFLKLVSTADFSLHWKPFFELAVEKRFSKSEFSQACELLVLYFQRDSNVIQFNGTENAGPFLEKLKEQVYPRASRADDQMKQKLQAQSWYQKNWMRWTRQGDRAGLELKVSIQGPTEAKRLEKTFQSMLETLQKDGQFWNP